MKPFGKILAVVGSAGVLVGSLDPLEGSLLILPGSGLVALGVYLGRASARVIKDWAIIFACNAVGIAALWWLSERGGIGGKDGRSLWWGLLLLPYLFGWIMGLVRIFETLTATAKARWHAHRPGPGKSAGL